MIALIRPRLLDGTVLEPVIAPETLFDGVTMGPPEKILRRASNDRLLTDHVMANPTVAEAYGALTRFGNPSNPDEFKPSRVVGYYRNDDSKVVVRVEDDPFFRAWRIVNPGNLSTDYPHAGLLNTKSELSS